ncbi:hypothetical protein B0J18DRAFT_156281 [Chaetomium sp. MPI-SDFR-AT-0129]|nr:hypothetical protein B0J18DRAFT_156281 [Chaetomium sp. MPI-SDFR-AT-0129]
MAYHSQSPRAAFSATGTVLRGRATTTLTPPSLRSWTHSIGPSMSGSQDTAASHNRSSLSAACMFSDIVISSNRWISTSMLQPVCPSSSSPSFLGGGGVKEKNAYPDGCKTGPGLSLWSATITFESPSADCVFSAVQRYRRRVGRTLWVSGSAIWGSSKASARSDHGGQTGSSIAVSEMSFTDTGAQTSSRGAGHGGTDRPGINPLANPKTPVVRPLARSLPGWPAP